MKEGQLDSRFRLVVMAAQRAKELAFGAKPKVETRSKKLTTIALEEAIADKLEFLTGEDARVANDEAAKMDYKRFLEEKRKEAVPEDLTELERDLRTYLSEREELDRSVLEDLFSEKSDETDAEG
jgi:DNA-directed RNA polymerase subunit omega